MRMTRTLVSLTATALMLVSMPVLAQEEPTVVESIGISTPYPSVAVEAGDQASFALSLVAPQPTPMTLEATGLPEGWTGVFRGGGFEIDGVTAGPEAPELSLDVGVPIDAAEGTYDIGVSASGGGASLSLALQIRVSAQAGGEVTLTPDFPGLRVPTGETASFSVELRNDTPSDLEFELSSSGPAGWEVTAEPATEPQATTMQVEAGSTAQITVDATAPAGVESGQYPVSVQASSPDTEVHADMIVEIVGSFSLELGTPDQRLSTEVSSDGSTDIILVVTNSGTAPISNVELSATAPSNWDVTFAEQVVPQLAAGESANVTATVTPSDQAIAGDYVITFRADSAEANSTVDIRTTVNPSAIWGFVGVALIVLVLVGLAWVFRRFGRR